MIFDRQRTYNASAVPGRTYLLDSPATVSSVGERVTNSAGETGRLRAADPSRGIAWVAWDGKVGEGRARLRSLWTLRDAGPRA